MLSYQKRFSRLCHHDTDSTRFTIVQSVFHRCIILFSPLCHCVFIIDYCIFSYVQSFFHCCIVAFSTVGHCVFPIEHAFHHLILIVLFLYHAFSSSLHHISISVPWCNRDFLFAPSRYHLHIIVASSC